MKSFHHPVNFFHLLSKQTTDLPIYCTLCQVYLTAENPYSPLSPSTDQIKVCHPPPNQICNQTVFSHIPAVHQNNAPIWQCFHPLQSTSYQSTRQSISHFDSQSSYQSTSQLCRHSQPTSQSINQSTNQSMKLGVACSPMWSVYQ